MRFCDIFRLRNLIPSLALTIAGAGASYAQESPVDQYELVEFDAEWDSLRAGVATSASYGGRGVGSYQFNMPFEFKYDGNRIFSGTTVSVSANGALVFADRLLPDLQAVGNVNYPLVIGPFNGDLMQGTDQKSGFVDTLGYYQVTGVEPDRVLTVEWRAFHLRGGGNGAGNIDTLAAMQVKLYERSGNIEFHYRDHGLDMPSRHAQPPLMSIGLNGTSTSKVYAKDTKVIPTRDIRFIPGVLSVDVKDEARMQIYPNPATNYLRFVLPETERITGVTLADALGRKHDARLEDDRLDLRSLPAGVYMLSITTDHGAYTREVSVVR
jgi:hypothetical protein